MMKTDLSDDFYERYTNKELPHESFEEAQARNMVEGKIGEMAEAEEIDKFYILKPTDISSDERQYFGADFDPNSLEKWRSRLTKLNYLEKEISFIEQAKRTAIEQYDSGLKVKKERAQRFKDQLEAKLLESDFTTETGGYKMDHIKDVGSISVSKKMHTAVYEEEKIIQTGTYVRTVVEIDKNAIKKELQNYESVDGKYVDKETGHVFEDVTPKSYRKLSFKFYEGR